jgi:hypothetical protein
MNSSKASLVAQFKASGLTQETFCKNNNIPLERLRYHLYKKNRTKTHTGNRSIGRKNTAPAFISFQKPTEQFSTKEAPCNCTIIHGVFTCQQLAQFIRELGATTC